MKIRNITDIVFRGRGCSRVRRVEGEDGGALSSSGDSFNSRGRRARGTRLYTGVKHSNNCAAFAMHKRGSKKGEGEAARALFYPRQLLSNMRQTVPK